MTRAWWPRLRLLAGVAILGVLVWRLGGTAFLDGLRVLTGPVFLAALGIGLLTTLLSAWRWCLVARGLGLRLPLGRAVADYYRSLFLNAALPGGVLGDVHRAVRHGQQAGDVTRGVRAVVLDEPGDEVEQPAHGVDRRPVRRPDRVRHAEVRAEVEAGGVEEHQASRHTPIMPHRTDNTTPCA